MMNLEFIYLFTYLLPPRQPTPSSSLFLFWFWGLFGIFGGFLKAIAIMRRAAADSLSVKSNVLGNDCAP